MKFIYNVTLSEPILVEQDRNELVALIGGKADTATVEALSTEVSKKANTSDVEALGTRVGAAETAIGTKADASAVEALGTRVGAAETAIGNKADASTVAAIDTRLTTAEGTLATLSTTVGGKIGWDVSVAGTPIALNKDGNAISFLTGDNLTVGADGKLDIAQSVVTALNSIAGKLDKSAIGDGLTLAEVDGAEKLTLNYNSDQFVIADGALELNLNGILTPSNVGNDVSSPFYVDELNNVSLVLADYSGLRVEPQPDNTGEGTTYALTIDMATVFGNLSADYGVVNNGSLVTEYDFSTLGGVFNAVKAIAELLGATVTGWPVEATA